MSTLLLERQELAFKNVTALLTGNYVLIFLAVLSVMSIMALSAAEPTVWPWCHELLAAVIAHFRIAEYAILTYNWES